MSQIQKLNFISPCFKSYRGYGKIVASDKVQEISPILIGSIYMIFIKYGTHIRSSFRIAI